MDHPLGLSDITKAATEIGDVIAPTPLFRWPLLDAATGVETWLKHENTTRVGAFKVRGGLTFVSRALSDDPSARGFVTATRGNHGQSIAFAAGRHQRCAVIVVPLSNSIEKNAAMRALGAEVIEAGESYQQSRGVAAQIAQDRGLVMVPPFHPWLLAGVATYALEMFGQHGELDTVYVPIGMGSGAACCVMVRDFLGLATKIVGVVSSHAPAYARSLEQNRVVEVEAATKLADGLSCSAPDPDALAILGKGLDRVVQVSDTQVAQAMRDIFSATHHVAEGAGAAAVAGCTHDLVRPAGPTACILSGSNVDLDVFANVLDGTWS